MGGERGLSSALGVMQHSCQLALLETYIIRQVSFDSYTLFDGLAYNTCRYSASRVVFFWAPQGRGKIRAMSNMSARIIMLNHRIRDLLFHYKKKIIWQLASTFVRVFRDILILSVRMTLTISKMFALIICQTIECDDFWKLRCWKSARRCGAKHIWK